jgi:hypothetical protein
MRVKTNESDRPYVCTYLGSVVVVVPSCFREVGRDVPVPLIEDGRDEKTASPEKLPVNPQCNLVPRELVPKGTDDCGPSCGVEVEESVQIGEERVADEEGIPCGNCRLFTPVTRILVLYNRSYKRP